MAGALAGWLLCTRVVSTSVGGAWTAGLRTALGLAAVLSAILILLGRDRQDARERDTWRAFATAAALLSIGLLAEFVNEPLRIHPDPPSQAGWGCLVSAAATFLAAGWLYRGLVQWNRFRTPLSDPADWLNGFSSVLALTAGATIVVRHFHLPASGWPWWLQQAWLLSLASTVVLFGTLATVTSIAALGRDRRAWLLAGGLAAGSAGQLASALFGQNPWATGSWAQGGTLLTLALIALASRLPRNVEESMPSMTSSSTAGAIVVLTSSAVVLALNTATGANDRLATAYAVLAFAGASTRSARIIRDLAQLAQSRLEARTDELTGLANRRQLMSWLETGTTDPGELCLLLIDLDRFKDVNDRHGHAMGDELLKCMATRLERQLPRDGLLARLGGDEFAILLRGSSVEAANAIAADVVTAVSALAVIGGRPLAVGVSIGISTGHADSAHAGKTSGGELLRRADVAMYVAKRAHTAVAVFDASLEQAISVRAEKAEQLQLILAEDASELLQAQVISHYQPQVDAASGDVVGIEALARWEHPSLGLLGPDAFLDIVEEDGLMTQLTGLVLQRATRLGAELKGHGRPVRVAVNVSASSLSDPRLQQLIGESLASARLEPELLTVEITETALMTHPEHALDAVRRIAATGVGVSIDDYGTGYASLAYLNELAAVELKLDRALTQRVASNGRTEAIVSGTIDLAHRLGLRVVAEGVEDTVTHDKLCRLGCDELQGYLYAKPKTAQQLREWLDVPPASGAIAPRRHTSLAPARAQRTA